MKLLDVDTGFRKDGALVVGMWLPETRLVERAGEAAEIRNVELVERFTERLRTLPGVERVGGINHLPLEGGGPNGTFVVLDRPDEIVTFDDFRRLTTEPARTGNAEFRVASADYFAAMSIPLVRGRLFDERDTRDAPHVAVDQRRAGRDALARRRPARQADPVRQHGRRSHAVHDRRHRRRRAGLRHRHASRCRRSTPTFASAR